MVLSHLAQKMADEKHEHHFEVEFDLKIPFNTQSLTKRQGYMC
jgi:hypothetical protein